VIKEPPWSRDQQSQSTSLARVKAILLPHPVHDRLPPTKSFHPSKVLVLRLRNQPMPMALVAPPAQQRDLRNQLDAVRLPSMKNRSALLPLSLQKILSTRQRRMPCKLAHVRRP
jgi:hypothetical protein